MRIVMIPGAAWACVAAGGLTLAVFLWRSLSRQGRMRIGAAWTLLLPALMGLGLARAGFEALQALEEYGAFQWTFRWCYTAGLAGISLGVWLAARRSGASPGKTLDAMAPAICLAMAFCRGSQAFLGETGIGPILDHSRPWTVLNDWEEPVLATWMLETVWCLLCAAAAAALQRRQPQRAGNTFWMAACALLIPQILLEQFRSGAYLRFMMMRLEQVLYLAWALAAVFLAEKRRARRLGRKGPGAYPGVFALLALAAGIALCQFMLDGKVLPSWPKGIGWGLYGAMILGMGAVCARILRQDDRTEEENR